MNRPEQTLQKSIVEWLHVAAPDLLFFHPANAIDMKGAQAARMVKRNIEMGMLPGAADLCFVLPGTITSRAYIGFIELKAPGTGHRKSSQSDSQKQFQADCQRSGAFYAVCDSIEQVEGTLRGWGVALRVVT